jgi:hypothetical protein
MFALPRTELPAPMVEPIHAPASGPPDGKLQLGSPSLALFREVSPPDGVGEAAPAIDENPAPDAGADLTARELPTPDRIPARSTTPAIPGLPGHPMNDSALQNPPMTVPATNRADSKLAPEPVSTHIRPKLIVLRGLRIDVEYPVYEGRNTVGRFADKPVDIDLMNQESVEQIWCSRQHAVVTYDTGVVAVEDLNSLNGTWVNGVRIHPGQRKPLKPGDVLQIGTVQLKLVLG